MRKNYTSRESSNSRQGEAQRKRHKVGADGRVRTDPSTKALPQHQCPSSQHSTSRARDGKQKQCPFDRICPTLSVQPAGSTVSVRQCLFDSVCLRRVVATPRAPTQFKIHSLSPPTGHQTRNMNSWAVATHGAPPTANGRTTYERTHE